MRVYFALHLSFIFKLLTNLVEFILLTQEEEIQRLRKEKSALLNEIKSIRKALRAGEPKKEVKEETKEEDTSNMTEQEKLILQLKKEREALQQSLTETMNIIPPKHEKKVHNVKGFFFLLCVIEYTFPLIFC